MTAEQVNDILGCGLEQAAGLLDAAGGDVGLAIELGMGMLGGDDGGGGGGPPTVSSSPVDDCIWPDRSSDLPDSWKNQRLDDFVPGTDRIRQPFNGPCGVLAVVQAELFRLEPEKQEDPTNQSHLTEAIASILQRISRQSGNTNVQLKDEDDALSIADAASKIRTAPDLMRAAVLLAGVDKVSAGPASSLVEGPHWLCSSDLMCLLMRGRVDDGNFGAWHSITQQKQNFYPSDFSTEESQIGILSIMENEQGVPVADDLKLGKSIWIVHTGDHFMTMKRRQVEDSNKVANNDPSPPSIQLELYNGLPPEGPCTKIITVSGNITTAGPAPAQQTQSFRKRRQGQPDDIVQAKKTDNTDYKEWKFEVVAAVDDPTVHGPIDDDPNEPVWSFRADEEDTGKVAAPPPLDGTSPWRCCSCYATRFSTMNFGMNDAGSTTCSACGKPMEDAMWSVWLPYSDLSPRMKRRARQMYAPKVEMVIASLYPKAEITEETIPMK